MRAPQRGGLDDAAGSAKLEEFSDRRREVTNLAQDLATFVGYLAATVAKESEMEPAIVDPTVGPWRPRQSITSARVIAPALPTSRLRAEKVAQVSSRDGARKRRGESP